MKWWNWFHHEPDIISSDKEKEKAERQKKPRVIMSLDHSWMNWIGILWFTYYRLIRRAGGVPMRVYFGDEHGIDLKAAAEKIMKQGDALFLSGGGDVDPVLYHSNEDAYHVNPNRDRFEMALIEYALEQNIPVLGICRGCQLLNVTLGGTLQTIRNDPQLKTYHNRLRPHPVYIKPDSQFAEIVGGDFLGSIRSIHGQAVQEPGQNLQIIAHAKDGIPEAYESTMMKDGRWIVGIQWHPELMPFKNQEHRLIEAFIDQARKQKPV